MSEPYQVFICFKHTGKNGKETRDSIIAREMYDYLVARGLQVFFSPISLKKSGSSEFIKEITPAIDQSSILIVVATCKENIESSWVREEWTAFHNEITSGRKPDGQIFTYLEGMGTGDLPIWLRKNTMFRHQDAKGLEELWVYINNSLQLPKTHVEEKKPQDVIQDTSTLNLSLCGMPMDFIYVPAGKFIMGSDMNVDKDAYGNETPQHKVHLDEYWIARYPVTSRQFAFYLSDSGDKYSADLTDGIDLMNVERPDYPVVQVSWMDSMAFCRWASRVSGRIIGLPTESQWEKAARGKDGRIYPWGSELPSLLHANFNHQVGFPTSVGSYPKGKSPYGVFDMAGNVWEWCIDWFAVDYYQNSPLRNPQGASFGTERNLRGGSWNNNQKSIRCACRNRSNPERFYKDVGFRVVVLP